MVNLDYLYNPAAAKNIFGKKRFVDKPLSFSVIENGTILPHKDIMVDGKWTWGSGGIIDGEGEFIKSSHVFSGAGKSYTSPHGDYSQLQNGNLSRHILSRLGSCNYRQPKPLVVLEK